MRWRRHAGAGGPSDDELIARLRRTFQAEAGALEPHSGRTPAVLAGAVHPRPRPSRRAPLAIGGALVLAVGALGVAIGLSPQAGRTTVGVAAPSPVPAPPQARSAQMRRASAAQPSKVVALRAGFTPESVTFVTSNIGWVLGSEPCASTRCWALAATTDDARIWQGAPLPPIQWTSTRWSVRFANTMDGWIFSGPGSAAQVWATTDGGSSWFPETLPGTASALAQSAQAQAQLQGLEVTAGKARAALLDPATSTVSLDAVKVGSTRWVSSNVGIAAASGPAAQLVLQGSAGWVLGAGGSSQGGARLVAGAWRPWRGPCGSTAGVVLAAPTVSSMLAVCPSASGGPESVLSSRDGGSTFNTSGTMPTGVTVGALSAATPSILVAAASSSDAASLLMSTNSGRSWTTQWTGGAGDSVLQVGFENPLQGVAIVSGPSGGQLLMTFNAGRSWGVVPVG